MGTAHIITDLFFGDGSKGAWVDWFCEKNSVGLVIKHTGGAQCSHHVGDGNGGVVEFSQVGSGHLRGVPTHVGDRFLFNPFNLAVELNEVGRSAAVTVDERTPIITPYQRWAGIAREELRGAGLHGSCGQGIGETGADLVRNPDLIVRAGDLTDEALLGDKLRFWQASKEALLDFHSHEFSAEVLHGITQPVQTIVDAYRDHARSSNFTVVDETFVYSTLVALERLGNDIVFEGAQGVLLDEWFGFHPHTTWSTTTHENALDILDDADWSSPVNRVGVVRAYGTRHGAGPFPTERKLDIPEPEDQNGDPDETAGVFRVGDFDATLVRYAIEVCGGIDTLAVSHLDVASPANVCVASGYRLPMMLWRYPKLFTGGVIDPNTAVGVIVVGKAELDRQERLTEALFTAKPSVRTLLPDGVEGAEMIAAAVGHDGPVLTAFGPDASDRAELRAGVSA